jgi:hypothetical protein
MSPRCLCGEAGGLTSPVETGCIAMASQRLTSAGKSKGCRHAARPPVDFMQSHGIVRMDETAAYDAFV